jgi:membrane protease YdiL (CAAX protease family)
MACLADRMAMLGVVSSQLQSRDKAALAWRPIPALVVTCIILALAYFALPFWLGIRLDRDRSPGLSLLEQALVILLVLLALASEGGNAAGTPALKCAHNLRSLMPVAAAALACLAALALAVRYGPGGAGVLSLSRTSALPLGQSLVAGFSCMVGAPIAEEMLFRGFLLPALARSRTGFWGGATVTSALWANMHFLNAGYGLLSIALIFAGGIGLSCLWRHSGAIWPCIVAHGCLNALPAAILVKLAS